MATTEAADHFERLEAMADDGGHGTWDLSDNDRAAIRWALESVKGFRVAVRKMLILEGRRMYECSPDPDDKPRPCPCPGCVSLRAALTRSTGESEDAQVAEGIKSGRLV